MPSVPTVPTSMHVHDNQSLWISGTYRKSRHSWHSWHRYYFGYNNLPHPNPLISLNLVQTIILISADHVLKRFYTFDGEKLRETAENNGIITKTVGIYETVIHSITEEII